MKRIVYIFLLLFFSVVSAQQNRVAISIDTTKNKIGAQFNLTLKTNVDTLSTVVFPSGLNFGPLEVIRNYVVDTIRANNRYELVKKYGLAQFDSGRYTIPPLRVLIDKKPFMTIPITVEVANVAVDTLKQKMYDIKPIIAVPPVNQYSWVKYLLILLAIGAIGFLVYRLIRKAQERKAEKENFKTPIERATSLLQNLEKKELWQKGEVKTYYSELTDIARNYIEEAIHIPAMESTTSELIDALRIASEQKRMTVSPEILKNLQNVLQQADLVKFAKSKPLDFEIADDREKIERVIVTLDKSVPEVSEDEVLMREIARQKMLRRQKRNRIFYTAAAVFALLAATTVYFVATKGFDFVKDNLLGHPTKDLVEGEWVTSEYGHPAISIETPRVLRRMDAEKIMPKEAMALLKEFQMFAYGSMLDNFYVAVSTNTYKGEIKIDLSKAVEGMIQVLEMQGAKNILVKNDQYQTIGGIEGLKAYGSLTVTDPKTKEKKKLHYEALIFGQENGLQQIVILHEDDDKYAAEIRNRILNSVELKKLNQ